MPCPAVVPGELLDSFVVDEVEPGIADVRPEKTLMADPSHGEGGSHALGVSVLLREFGDVVVALPEEGVEGGLCIIFGP